MKKSIRKLLAVLMTAGMMGTMLGGCGSNEGTVEPVEETRQEMTEDAQSELPGDTAENAATADESEGVSGKISMAVAYTDNNLEEFKNIISGFEE